MSDRAGQSKHRTVAILTAVALASGLSAVGPTDGVGSAAAATGATGSFVLTATNTGAGYAPTYTGNGLLGIRVPPSGQGYAPGPVPTEAQLAGFYAQAAGGIQQRAAIPTWSSLVFGDGGRPALGAEGATADWRQSIDLHTGIVTTGARWTAPDGHQTTLSEQVLTDRALPDVGLVKLTVTPSWSGPATVTDGIDGDAATLTTQTDKGWSTVARTDWESVTALGTGITAAIASTVRVSPGLTTIATPVDQSIDRSVGQQLAFSVVAGRTYTFSKYVAVVSSQQNGAPVDDARRRVGAAAAAGYPSLVAASDAAWSSLWSGRIDVLGNPSLATDVNASEFYLWSSVRDGIDWSVSPAGLSSNGYNGHIFWDADTWMEPALLAQHPDLATSIDAYRSARLETAVQHAAASGYQGARFPWESALDGTEQIPPPASVFTEGIYEIHVTADIALTQWQYFLSTGDKGWLAREGWPVISAAATYWASRATVGADGAMHLDGVTGPDEENADVNDEAYTDAAARLALLDAVQAAHTLGHTPPSAWARVAAAIGQPTGAPVPEFAGYPGSMVKQADVTLLQYPLGVALPAGAPAADLNYYAPRVDPNGPSMSDAVNAIDAALLGNQGCASYVYTLRSVQPFIRDAFDQFSETRTGGAFTFLTGIGGFLQEFLYGASGLRFGTSSVSLAPDLTRQIGGIRLEGLRWHGRRFTVTIGQRQTTVTLDHGAPLPIATPSGLHVVTSGAPLTVGTHRPDLASSPDLARCAATTASSSAPGSPSLAAVDGSPATGWQPTALPATLTVRLPGGRHLVHGARILWGRQWPGPPSATQPPPPGPVTVRRADTSVLTVSTDGHHWHVVAQSAATTGTLEDDYSFAPVDATEISLRLTGPSTADPPIVDELTAN